MKKKELLRRVQVLEEVLDDHGSYLDRARIRLDALEDKAVVYVDDRPRVFIMKKTPRSFFGGGVIHSLTFYVYAECVDPEYSSKFWYDEETGEEAPREDLKEIWAQYQLQKERKR